MQIVMTVVKRKQLGEVVALIEAHQPQAFYAVDDVQSAAAGIFPGVPKRRAGLLPSALRSFFSAW